MATKRRIMKHQRKSLTLETKLDVLNRIDSGQRQVDVSREVGLAGSTIRTILRNREKILQYTRAANNLGSVTKINRARPSIMVEMERLLNAYVQENMIQGVLLNWGDIQKKAMNLYEELKKVLPDVSDADHFIASKGWLERFRRRYYLYSIPKPEEETNGGSVSSEETQQYMNSGMPLQLSKQEPQDYSTDLYSGPEVAPEDSQEFQSAVLLDDQSGSDSPRLLESYSRASAYQESDSENPGDVVELIEEDNSNNYDDNKTSEEIIAADNEACSEGKLTNQDISKNARLTRNDRQWSRQNPETVAQVLKEYLDYRSARNQERQKNHIHSFFLAMADTVSKFPPQLQVKVKAEVFQAVNEGELEMVNSTPVFASVSCSTSQASNSQVSSQDK